MSSISSANSNSASGFTQHQGSASEEINPQSSQEEIHKYMTEGGDVRSVFSLVDKNDIRFWYACDEDSFNWAFEQLNELPRFNTPRTPTLFHAVCGSRSHYPKIIHVYPTTLDNRLDRCKDYSTGYGRPMRRDVVIEVLRGTLVLQKFPEAILTKASVDGNELALLSYVLYMFYRDYTCGPRYPEILTYIGCLYTMYKVETGKVIEDMSQCDLPGNVKRYIQAFEDKMNGKTIERLPEKYLMGLNLLKEDESVIDNPFAQTSAEVHQDDQQSQAAE